jgi:rhomboid protease GluP
MLAGAIILAWFLSALALDQPFFAPQKSSLLMTVGAVNGELLDSGEWWRIVTSQFLHVHFLHMLFNAGCIVVIGAFIEQRCGWWRVGLVYVIGGSVGQIASVVFYPEFVSSGASQALMALCGAGLVTLTECRSRLFVLAVVAIQAALDIYVAHKIKAGHGFGFLGGLLVGLALLFFGGLREVRLRSNNLLHGSAKSRAPRAIRIRHEKRRKSEMVRIGKAELNRGASADSQGRGNFDTTR